MISSEIEIKIHIMQLKLQPHYMTHFLYDSYTIDLISILHQIDDELQILVSVFAVATHTHQFLLISLSVFDHQH